MDTEAADQVNHCTSRTAVSSHYHRYLKYGITSRMNSSSERFWAS
jgi:hypothetical protein